MASSPPTEKQILGSIVTGDITKTDVEFTNVIIYASGIHGYATKKNPEDNTASKSIFSKISFGSLSIRVVRICALGIS